MSDFKEGGVPTPDYDTEDINYISQKTEFTEDVFVYGKLYADLGGDLHTFTGNVDIDGHTNLDNVSIAGVATVTNIQIDNGSGSGISFLNDESKIQTGSSGHMLGIQGGATNMGGRIELRGGNDTGDIRMFAQGITSTQVLRLRIDSGGQVIFQPMSQTDRDALTPVAGGVIYNSTTNKLQCYNGTTWNNLF